jgi:hypothetical protein
MAKLHSDADPMCPICSSGRALAPENTSIVERVIFRVARIYAFRCHVCKRRFYLPHLKTGRYAQEPVQS